MFMDFRRSGREYKKEEGGGGRKREANEKVFLI